MSIQVLQDKLSVYMDRFLLLQQRLRRNRLFTAPVFGAGSHQQQQKPIEVGLCMRRAA